MVLSALYASTAFVKHSKQYRGEETNKFCQCIRSIIFDLLLKEQSYLETKIVQNNKPVDSDVLAKYINQHTSTFVERIAMDLVDFYKIFDKWHPGLNQLKKFNYQPFE